MDNAADIARPPIQCAANMGLPGVVNWLANPDSQKDEIARCPIWPIIKAARPMPTTQRDQWAKPLPPICCSAIIELTEGRSLTAIIALVAINARLRPKLRLHLCQKRIKPNFYAVLHCKQRVKRPSSNAIAAVG